MIDKRLVSVLNIFSTAIISWLFGVYGRLHWWLRSARRSGLSDPQLSADFLNAADKLHLIAIMLMLLVVVSSIAVLRAEGPGRTLGVISFFLAALFLTLLVMIRV